MNTIRSFPPATPAHRASRWTARNSAAAEKEHNIPSGSNYERCRSVHAEMNALIQAGKLARGCTLYLAGFDVATGELTQIWPCFLCSKMIVNSGIINVIMRTTPDEYKEMDPMVLYQMRSRESLGKIHRCKHSFLPACGRVQIYSAGW